MHTSLFKCIICYIIRMSDYSELTCTRYNQALTSLRRLFEDTFKSPFQNPDTFHTHSEQIMHLLSSHYQQSTIVNFISAILWNMNKIDRTLYPTQYINEISEMYRQHGKNIKDDIERSKIGKEFQLTEHEQKSFMIWEDILHIYSKVSSQINRSNYNDFMDFVILSLYILHPPVRADYANMKMFIEDSFIPENYSENYCVLQTNPRFVFHKYKTAKHRGTTIISIDPELHDILLDWAHINQSEYLLSTVSRSSFSENKLSKRITSIFTKYALRPVTINTLRHSFISFMSKHDQEQTNKQNNANKMMHSLSMADNYRRMVYLE